MQLCAITRPRSQEIYVLLVSFWFSYRVMNTRQKQLTQACKISGLVTSHVRMTASQSSDTRTNPRMSQDCLAKLHQVADMLRRSIDNHNHMVEFIHDLKKMPRNSLVAQQVKDLVLSLQWLGSLLWCGFDTWTQSLHMSWARPGKKKKKEVCKTHRCLRWINIIVLSHWVLH